MGNSLSFIISHGRRLKNRYNAQYRAIEFISKENRRSSPSHPNALGETTLDPAVFQELQKKDLKLDEYLKDVYLKSYDEVPKDSQTRRNNPDRPLPESREPKPRATFNEPEEVEKGWCTITQISEFIVSHEEDPVANNSKAIAEKYSLEEKKVENTLKYFSVFRVYDKVADLVPRGAEEWETRTIEDDKNIMKEGKEKMLELRKSLQKKLEDGRGKEETRGESGESSRSVEKAAKIDSS